MKKDTSISVGELQRFLDKFPDGTRVYLRPEDVPNVSAIPEGYIVLDVQFYDFAVDELGVSTND